MSWVANLELTAVTRIAKSQSAPSQKKEPLELTQEILDSLIYSDSNLWFGLTCPSAVQTYALINKMNQVAKERGHGLNVVVTAPVGVKRVNIPDLAKAEKTRPNAVAPITFEYHVTETRIKGRGRKPTSEPIPSPESEPIPSPESEPIKSQNRKATIADGNLVKARMKSQSRKGTIPVFQAPK